MAASDIPPIRVAPGGRYFETISGDPFLFIGPNDALSWPGLAGLFRRRDVAAVERYLEDLAAHGVTILRLMLEYSHDSSHYFERPYGRFNPVMVRFWDDLFALCARHGLRILLTPWDNFWMARRWHKHPYNISNGGPAHSPAAFFLDDTVVHAAIRRLQFVIQRWGGSGVLAAWDLFNEIHPYWGGTPEQQAEVISRISAEVRQAELANWGFTRPQTVSIFGPEPDPGYEMLIFNHPSLDFATTHVYQGAIDFPKETVTPAVTMGKWVRHATARVPAERPYCDTEHGPIHLFNDHKKMLDEAMDDEYERHLMWAHLASGGAGSGMRWPARHPHVLTNGTKRALSSLAAFTKLADWRCFQSADAAKDVRVSARGIHVFACRDDQQAILWLLRPLPEKRHSGMLTSQDPDRDLKIAVQGLLPGHYTVHQWDTAAGRSAGTIEATSNAECICHITLPQFRNDLALAIVRRSTPAEAKEADPK